ncbi:Plant intracellular ras-group-related lrr protein [Thalictrum thalictroides]|uniref:Plant intracellular ras-group-related lrr protein n=1 Tax=Thalictrum thalictroides TaxID=46969 RepID=A0A7J6UUX0_THATH|nr:Plant intracellular ras-group-related lrr protein [Thalictrum thalictroides]
MGSFLQTVDGVVEEIMRIHKSLPTRPGLEEIEAARAVIQNVEKEEQYQLEGISKQKKDIEVPEELFYVLQEMQRNLVFFKSKEEKREALKVLDLENVHALFDEYVQRASKCLPTGNNSDRGSNSKRSYATVQSSFSPSVATSMDTSGPSSSVFYSQKETRRSPELYSRDDSYVKKAKASLFVDGIGVDSSRPKIADTSLRPATFSSQDSEKLSLIKLASLIETSLKKGTKELNLQNKLMDQIQWLPDSIGKLSGLVTLDLSENRIATLPTTIGNLFSLTKLDLHSNKIAEIPDTIGNLLSLIYLDLRGNYLTSLPVTIGKLSCLQELDLSSNKLVVLPESIGNLISLKKLIVETNEIEEIPHNIGNCSSLVELRADYNRLKALPEAIGRLESLEILTVRYNNIKQLPTTMASLSNLKEINVSFNELESVPESLCLATSLVKMNVSNNFADLRSLPRSIGNLEMLEELDISNNQIRVLPESFRLLTQLRVLHAQENPLEVPPRYIAEQGAQAVVQYMVELVSKRDIPLKPVRRRKSWARLCFFSKTSKSEHNGYQSVKA